MGWDGHELGWDLPRHGLRWPCAGLDMGSFSSVLPMGWLVLFWLQVSWPCVGVALGRPSLGWLWDGHVLRWHWAGLALL
jgi:hypothetical protein